MVTTKCSECGQAMSVKPYRLKRNRSGLIFCSAECRQANGTTLGRPRLGAPELTCPICGSAFHRKPAEIVTVNYCSRSCAAAGTGNLKPPAKGERRSRSTEFTAGVRPSNKVVVGTVRTRLRRGEHRAWVKVGEPNRWRPRAIVEWETGLVLPSDMVVHHRDRDPMNDDPANLVALTRAMHLAEHRHEMKPNPRP